MKKSRSEFGKASHFLEEGKLDDLSQFSILLNKLISLDENFHKVLLSAKRLMALGADIMKLSMSLQDLLSRWQTSEWYRSLPLIEAKSICMSSLAIALVKKEDTSEALEKARGIFREHGFRRWKRYVEAIENFIFGYLRLYDLCKGQLSKRDEMILLKELKIAADLNGALSRAIAVRQLKEAQEELLMSFDKALDQANLDIMRFLDKGQTLLTRIAWQKEMSSLLARTEDMYEVYVSGRKEWQPLSYVEEILRKHKAKYDLWIDEERREVIVRGQGIRGRRVQKLLTHIAKNVGNVCDDTDLFKAIWDVKVTDSEISYSNYRNRLQQIFSRNIYKYGKGILKNSIQGEEGGYRILENLNSCLIVSPTSKHPN